MTTDWLQDQFWCIIMDIEILKTTENPAMHRKRIEFVIRHLGEGSPNRLEVRDKLAAMETSDSELTFIMSMKPRYGIPEISGVARIYTEVKYAEKIEANYVKIRNMPKDKRDEAWTAIKGKRQG